MDWDVIAPMIVALTLILSCAGVLIFRPLATRLGDLLEQMQQERRTRLDSGDLTRLTELLERLADRMDRMEERQEFAERLLERASRHASEREEATTRRD